MHLTAEQMDRAQGVLLGMAAGDALGAGYEFGAPVLTGAIEMNGGGVFKWAPGEWTDDTSMALIIANVAAAGLSLRDEDGLDFVVEGFVRWAKTAPDVGSLTRQVLGRVESRPTAEIATKVAKHIADSTNAAGNGGLMRTAPIALVYLHDEDACWDAAGKVGALTHGSQDSIEATQIWTLAIRHTVLNGDDSWGYGLITAMKRLPEDRYRIWLDRLTETNGLLPHEVNKGRNGWVVSALQAAYCAVDGSETLRGGLVKAVRAGDDTDTVAAIAGGLLGARFGASALPRPWREKLHGFPGLNADGLAALAEKLVTINEKAAV